jgi:uncharacterized membrane protein
MNDDFFKEKPQDKEEHAKMNIWQETVFDFRKRLIAGIILIIPITITALVLFFIIKTINKLFYSIVKTALPIETPILREIVGVTLSITVVFSIIYLVGLLSSSYAIRRVINYGERILARIPFIKILYLTTKQITDAITMPQSGVLKKIVAIEYPRRGIWSLGFVTGESVNEADNTHLVHIFVPTTPNPTSGFLLLLPLDQVYDINLTIDQGVKFIISAGIVKPEHLQMRSYTSILHEKEHESKKGVIDTTNENT